MAEPKRKVSKQRTNTRYANWKTTAPSLAECPSCKAPKLQHRACKACGYYDGVKVLNVDTKKK